MDTVYESKEYKAYQAAVASKNWEIFPAFEPDAAGECVVHHGENVCRLQRGEGICGKTYNGISKTTNLRSHIKDHEGYRAKPAKKGTVSQAEVDNTRNFFAHFLQAPPPAPLPAPTSTPKSKKKDKASSASASGSRPQGVNKKSTPSKPSKKSGISARELSGLLN
ncbi:uncharacterized protein SEPMUDRAFT_121756 [Sphaerulina musiva SO2202]|uniref:Uncharacterized protein n=1 Tax=Sphaerulina musiva (strain SO2202) TaxID=692275 RepID=M3C7L0_SPHMS|nr:uncharacterized protein SEPMUDRAFT_121756 [Sphaerulina musiva SO2202]EMF07890.1 hypothetical protein SEPMUDRAFT_121756 [Sphaerulina musiva SO2202]